MVADVAFEKIAPKINLPIVREELWLHVMAPGKKTVIRVAIGDDENLEALADKLSAAGYPAEADQVRLMMIEARRGA